MKSSLPYILALLVALGILGFFVGAIDHPSGTLEFTPEPGDEVRRESRPRRRSTSEGASAAESMRVLVEDLAHDDASSRLIARLKGSVRVAGGGAFVAEAEVFARRFEGPEGEEAIIARGESDAAGQFALALPRLLDAYRVALYAEHPDFRLGPRHVVRVAALSAVEADAKGRASSLAGEEEILLEVGEGGFMGGRALDLDGRPRAGAELIATSARVQLSSESTFKTGATLALALRESSDEDLHRVVTDDRGEFLFRGLNPALEYSLLAAHFDQLVTPPQRHRVGERDLVIRVAEARGLRGEIVDARSGKPVPRALLRLSVRAEGKTISRAGSCLDGRINFAWSRGSSQALEIDARLSAEGYEPLRRQVLVPAEVSRAEVRFELQPLAGDRIPLRVRDDRGLALRGPLRIEYRERGGGRRGTLKEPALGDRLERAILLPRGRWEIRVSPDHFAAPLAVSDWQVINTKRAEVTGVEFVLRGVGSLRIDLGSRAELPLSVLCVGERFVGSVSLDKPLSVFEALPAGTWRIVGPSASSAASSEVEVEIVAGGRRNVTLPW
jgi:hypothetical protein